MITTRTLSGRKIEFEDKPFSRGAMKEVHWGADRRFVVAFYRTEPGQAGLERLEALTGMHRTGILDGPGGAALTDLYRWPEDMLRWGGRTGIIVPAFASFFFFEHGSFDGDRLNIKGHEKAGKWFASAHNRASFLDPREVGDWRGYLKVCTRIAQGVRRLHAAGLAHSDLSYRNVLVDPLSGSACIVDIDGLVVPGKYPPEVVGTPDFVAPEVLATQHVAVGDPRRKLPSMQTDLHALAVLIYLYLLLRHPLKGIKVHDMDDPARDDMLSMGRHALWVEHPEDTSNRIDPSEVRASELPWAETSRLPYTLTGPYLAPLFEQAFIEGLHDPARRPRAEAWERALLMTADRLLPCSSADCPAGWFIYENSVAPTCPFCRKDVSGTVPILNLYSAREEGSFRPDNHRIAVHADMGLHAWHTNRFTPDNERLEGAERQRLARFEREGSQWRLVNERLDGVREIRSGQEVPPGSSLDLTDGSQILLDSARGGRLAQVQMAGTGRN